MIDLLSIIVFGITRAVAFRILPRIICIELIGVNHISNHMCITISTIRCQYSIGVNHNNAAKHKSPWKEFQGACDEQGLKTTCCIYASITCLTKMSDSDSLAANCGLGAL